MVSSFSVCVFITCYFRKHENSSVFSHTFLMRLLLSFTGWLSSTKVNPKFLNFVLFLLFLDSCLLACFSLPKVSRFVKTYLYYCFYHVETLYEVRLCYSLNKKILLRVWSGDSCCQIGIGSDTEYWASSSMLLYIDMSLNGVIVFSLSFNAKCFRAHTICFFLFEREYFE